MEKHFGISCGMNIEGEIIHLGLCDLNLEGGLKPFHMLNPLSSYFLEDLNAV